MRINYLGFVAPGPSFNQKCTARSWNLAKDYKTQHIYLSDGATTVETMVKCVRAVQDRRIMYSTASVQGDKLLKL